MSGIKHRSLAVLVALAALAAALIAPAGANAVLYVPEEPVQPGGPEFCWQTEVHNYLAPLERLPKLRHPAWDGGVGFTRADVSMQLTEPLVVGGGRIGFELSAAWGRPVLHPGWKVTATLARIDANGRALQRLGTLTRKVRALGHDNEVSTKFEVGARQALYRLTVVFRSRSGRKLAKYGLYSRVVRKVEDVRLALNASSYHREEKVTTQLRNFGTTTSTYGYGLWVEKLTPGGWVEAPENPRTPVPLPLIFLKPGTASPCEDFWIPPSTEPGRYRIERGGVHAEFDVLP